MALGEPIDPKFVALVWEIYWSHFRENRGIEFCPTPGEPCYCGAQGVDRVSGYPGLRMMVRPLHPHVLGLDHYNAIVGVSGDETFSWSEEFPSRTKAKIAAGMFAQQLITGKEPIVIHADIMGASLVYKKHEKHIRLDEEECLAGSVDSLALSAATKAIESVNRPSYIKLYLPVQYTDIFLHKPDRTNHAALYHRRLLRVADIGSHCVDIYSVPKSVENVCDWKSWYKPEEILQDFLERPPV